MSCERRVQYMEMDPVIVQRMFDFQANANTLYFARTGGAELLFEPDGCRFEFCKMFLETGKELLFQRAKTEAMLSSLVSLVPLWKYMRVTMWTPFLGFRVCFTQSLQCFYFSFSSCRLTGLSLHPCLAHMYGWGECGSLHHDSSVAHLILAWPYLGFPEIHFSALV